MVHILLLLVVCSFYVILEFTWDDMLIKKEVKDESTKNENY